jgi:sugar phosphate isomerase/epimerase
MPLDRALARIAWAGFRHAEIVLMPADPLPEAGSLARTLEAADLSLAAVDAGTLRTGDGATGLESAAHVGRCAVLAHSLRANRVICDLESDSEEQAREILGKLLSVLAEIPVLLCFRNRAGEGREAGERPLRLVTDNPDRLGLALNPGAAYRAGWDLLAEWPGVHPFVRHLYATDSTGPLPATPGTGDVPWEELAERLPAAGYSGAVSLWMEEGTFGDPLFAEAELKEARFLLESWFDGAR